jgi:hypothetical protein
MTSTPNKKGGSFIALRDQHLPLFEEKLHRHDRGWPHAPPDVTGAKSQKRRWKTIGIYHFPHHGDYEDR